jgi:hypothetical protein
MPEKINKSPWTNVKNILANQEKSELLILVKDLYDLNKKRAIHLT